MEQLSKLSKIWKSKLPRRIKVRLFIATVESVLLYGSETWTLTKSLEKRLNGCYTRMLRMCLNVSWQQKLTNQQLYQDLPSVAKKVQQRRMKLAGHCIRHPEISAYHLILWEPTSKGNRGRGRPRITYLDNLRSDTNLHDTKELQRAMEDKVLWRRLWIGSSGSSN